MKKVFLYFLIFTVLLSVVAFAEETEETVTDTTKITETLIEETGEGTETAGEKVEEPENLIRVGLFFGNTAVTELKVKTSQAFKLPGNLAPYYSLSFYYVYETGGMKVVGSNGDLLAEVGKEEPYLVLAESGEFETGGRTYRHSFEVTSINGALRVVNILPLDHYLYGVLPNEIYPSWGEEALRTTAVAARSFTLASVSGKHQSDGFDVCTNTHCQMYRGKGTEYKSTNKAVDDTSGLVLAYNGKIISAMYNANNGGYTEGTENVWVAKLPYYVAKPDPYTPEDVWSVSFTPEEVKELLAKRGVDIGEVRRIEVESYAQSGRAIKLTVVGRNGEYSLTKDSIRSLFNLRSTMFTVNTTGTASKSFIDAIIAMENSADVGLAVASLTDTNLTFTFNGRGYGHGVGISQWGCKYMADAGKTYEEILGFYYEGAEIKHLNDFAELK